MNFPQFPVKPEEFWQEFSKKFREKWFSNVDKGEKAYGNDSLLTPWMMGLLEDLKDSFNCEVTATEHWPKIDLGFFNRETATEWEEWSLEIAIEHENKNWPHWQDEVRKLMMLNAGLKVLISYRKESKEKLENQLNEFVKIYQSRKYHTENDSWLFIFGPNMLIWNDNDFIAYKFDGKIMTEITAGLKTFN